MVYHRSPRGAVRPQRGTVTAVRSGRFQSELGFAGLVEWCNSTDSKWSTLFWSACFLFYFILFWRCPRIIPLLRYRPSRYMFVHARTHASLPLPAYKYMPERVKAPGWYGYLPTTCPRLGLPARPMTETWTGRAILELIDTLVPPQTMPSTARTPDYRLTRNMLFVGWQVVSNV